MRVRKVLKNTMQVFLCCLILSGCFVNSLSETTTNEPPNSLTVVDTQENNDDVQVDVEDGTEEEVDYDPMNVFVPTKEWKAVKPGQVVPDGLHVRLNMETGQKEAKLMEGDSQAKYWKLGGKQGMVNSNKKTFTVDELKKALKDFKSETVGNPTENTEKFKSYKELRKDFEAMNMNVETDMEIITGLMKRLKREDIDIDETKHILMDLEYYLHQIDNAVHFADSGGFGVLLKFLNSTSEEIRSETAMVLGSALQSNPKVQITAIENGFLQMLLRMISVEDRVFIKKRVLYALSSLIRHFPYAQIKFVEHGGLSVFNKIFEEDGAEVLKVKIITLLNDLLLERKLTEEDKSEDSATYKEKLKQYKQLDLEKKLVDAGWCRLIPPVLQLTDHDSREKIINAMNTMITPCYNDFSLFRSQILDLQKFYHRLANIEKEDDYFKKIHKSLTKITEMLVITEL